MIGRITAAILIAGFALVSEPVMGPASAEPRDWDRGRGHDGGSDRGHWHGKGYNRGWGWGWGWGSRPRPPVYRDPTIPFLGGIIGGMVGSMFRSDDKPQEIVPGTQRWYDYCTNKYRSFDPETGTYTAYSGEKKPCL